MSTAAIRATYLAVSAVLGAALLTSCAGEPDGQITLVGFAAPAEANDELFNSFTETAAGQRAQKAESYGASGDQSRSVANGLPADLVHLSISPDLERLVEAGLVAEDWDDNAWGGQLTTSVVVLVVREGNPLGITGWEDMIREDVSIVTPNPGSSGAARWNILGALASQLQDGSTPAETQDYMEQFVDNVAVFPGSGRDATIAFLDGTGDVLVSYENEAILGVQQGEELDYIVPRTSVLIENVAAVTEDAPAQARQFHDFALSPAGQAIYASFGFRPVEHGGAAIEIDEVRGANDPARPFPAVEHLATVDEDFGGWDQVMADYFDEDGLITRLIEDSGRS
ncbi:sulfate ABC transporter substrate-binding protein [Nesterenkonia aurantiaca]|uniref:Sulfate transport system substrate-binding protein n=1 Tax=Nesterenkonia aurantiaca TaxID=1436010 RepID=A0A4R7FWQ1_9MICC|nr:sulfate ABC transporter substrate-binding protein [Nesterenkonia aurantiaca]TDS83057.1 sulfate transport system substrate-binding protein [Nesterenkonia aurantiaca]